VSFLLLVVGVLALVTGLLMVGFGIPINEFSFGNTLIMAGTTAAVGGLIIIGLGIAVGQLRRIAEMLAFQSPVRPAQPGESHEGTGRAAPAQGRIAFPLRPKPEPHPTDMALASVPAEDRASQFAAPKLRNPDEAQLTVEDDISLSPPQPSGGNGLSGAGKSEPVPPWRTSPPPPPPRPNFDAMWPAESKPVSRAPEAKPELSPEAVPREPLPAAVRRAEQEPPKPRAVAILKSGVVDGMGYTLYVDGSIEAEMPQGTLRFASINELRSHLEKNS